MTQAADRNNPVQRWRTEAHVLPMAGPADWSALAALIERREIMPGEIVAVLGKTEGNGCVNDFTRAYASTTLEGLLAAHGVERAAMPIIVMSGGTEGVLTPHATIFTRRPEAVRGAVNGFLERVEGTERIPGVDYSAQDGRREATGEAGAQSMLIAAGRSASLAPEDLGTLRQAYLVAETVQTCLAESQMVAPAFVQVKCPLLTAARVEDARRRGRQVQTAETYRSMALSRAASALGVALALGEVDEDALDDAAIGHDLSLFSQVASTSSGIELMHHEIFVLGPSPLATGPLRIGHAVMRHPLDVQAFELALCRATECADPRHVARERIVQVLAKAEAPPDGQILGQRHTMLDDSDIAHSRMARAVVGAVLAAAAKRTPLYISGGAEHQGPPGGGPIAVIYRKEER